MTVYRITVEKEIIYKQINTIISFLCLKIITPITKIGIIYHKRVNNILKETIGCTDVTDVINIHNI